jgi:hypothetical protein
MKNSVLFGVALLFALGSAACGKETGRIPLKADGTGSTTINAKRGQTIGLWTSLDASYEGTLDARYDVRLLQGGAAVATATCNPMDVNVKTMAITVTMNDRHKISYQGKMRCELTAPADGPATIEATLAITPTPGLAVRDMSLVVKQ